MKKRKTYEISVIDRTYSKTISDETKFYTSDTSLELVFKLKETEYTFESAEIVLLNIDDRSLVTRPVAKILDSFTYELDDDITAHYGDWRGQVRFEQDGEVYVSSPVKFRIENDLSNERPPQLSDVQSWVSLKRYADDLIDELKQAVMSVEAMEDTLNENETNRQRQFETAEQSRQTTFGTNESERADTFNANEEVRKAQELEREKAENNRQTTFTTNEANRNQTFNTNEASRQANETARIEAEKQRNETVKNIEDRQSSVENQFISVQEELTEKDVISAPEIIAARGDEPTLSARLEKDQQEVTAKLAQTVTEVGNTNSTVVTYDVEVFNTSMLQGKTSEQVVNEYFEPMRLANQTYIKRELLGKDATNAYNIYKYVLSPPNYSKTIFINTVLHGGEVTFLATMYELIKKLTGTEKTNNAYIEYLRNNVRIIFIPIANPWGFNQPHRTRWNGNGVNLARNSSFNWEQFVGTVAFGQDYKGTAPFSEKETQYIKEILDTETIDLYLDLHNTGAGTGLSYYAITEVESLTWYPLNAILKELKEFNDLSGNISLGRTNDPLMSSYGSSLGIYSTTLEVADGNFDAVYSDAEINKSMELLLSSIKSIFNFDDYKQLQDFNSDNLKNPVEINQFYWNNTSTSITFNSTDWVELPQFRISYENEEKINGFVEVDFDFVIKNDTEGAINYLVALIEHGGTGSASVLPLGLNFDDRYNEGNLRTTLGVKATAYTAGGYYPIIKFYGKTTKGNVHVWRARGTVKRTRTERQQMSRIDGTYKEGNASGSVFIPKTNV